MAYMKLLLVLPFVVQIFAENKLKLVKEWKELDFSFPDEATLLEAESKNFYVRGNSVPIDVDVFYDHKGKTKVFVSIPRFDIGRPFTLATISSEPGPDGRTLKPYPDYSWHDNQGNNCEGITSVFRIAIDECARLWVLDTGKIGENAVCPPQLLAFDLKTDKLLHVHKINPSALRSHSLVVTPVVDVRDPKHGCKDTFVYIADITGFNMVVYDHANDKSWMVENKYFYPYPSQGTFEIAGEMFELMDGIIGMALSPLKHALEDRILYFHALASNTENYVKTSVLRNETAWGEFSTADPRDFQTFKGTRPSQAAAEAMDSKGILYFGLATTTAIACWNSGTDFSHRNIDIVAHDPLTLQFASGVKIVKNLKGEEELWVLTCRFQKLMTGSMRLDEVNFRIQAGKVEQLVKGTKCARPNGRPQFQGNLPALQNPNTIGSSNYGSAK